MYSEEINSYPSFKAWFDEELSEYAPDVLEVGISSLGHDVNQYQYARELFEKFSDEIWQIAISYSIKDLTGAIENLDVKERKQWIRIQTIIVHQACYVLCHQAVNTPLKI